MSEPTRFRDGGGNDVERLLVDSVRDHAPSPRTRRRAQAALGIGAAASTATASTGALGATMKTGVTLGVAKWVGIATVGVALAGAGTASYLGNGASRGAAAPARTATPSAIRVQTPRAAVSTSTVPMVTEAPAPPPPASASVSVSAERPVAAPIASTRPAPTLGDEIRLLDEAHAALSAGDTSGALALLDRHDREVTKPALAPEALSLRVEVYARLGDRAAVTRTANQFLAQYGDRPEARRIRTILDANQ